MQGHTIRLHGKSQREHAKRVIDQAPAGAIVKIREPKRTDEQNRKLQVMIRDIQKAKPKGLKHSHDQWRGILMNMFGHEIQWLEGLDGAAVPFGKSTASLSVKEGAEFIEFLYSLKMEFPEIQWSEPPALAA